MKNIFNEYLVDSRIPLYVRAYTPEPYDILKQYTYDMKQDDNIVNTNETDLDGHMVILEM